MKFLLNIIYGMIVGIANIIPGVSGGTMAVILNIYDELISSFTGLRKHFKKSILYLLPIVIGAVAGVFGFSKLLEFLLNDYPMPTNFFFIGLIVGGLPLVFRKAMETKFKPVSVIPFIIFLGIMIALAFINTGSSETAGIITTLDFGTVVYMILGSALAAMCMIIPGVSGSMIMMIIGLYNTVLTSISNLNIVMLIPVAVGIIIGIVGGAKLIDICIKKFPQATFFAIMGLMIGSLLSVYNNSGFVFNVQGIIAIFTFIAGFLISFAFGSEKLKEKFSKNKKTKTKNNSVSEEK